MSKHKVLIGLSVVSVAVLAITSVVLIKDAKDHKCSSVKVVVPHSTYQVPGLGSVGQPYNGSLPYNTQGFDLSGDCAWKIDWSDR